MRRDSLFGLLFLASWVTACEIGPPEVPPGYQGIIEYEERTLAFELPGRLEGMVVDEGVELSPGDEIGRLDDTLEVVARGVQEAQAKAVRARVTLLEAGVRQEDIKALRAEVTAAKAAETLAQHTLE